MPRTYYFDINGKKEPDCDAMLAFFLDEEIVFCNSRKYLNLDKSIQKETIVVFVNINDIFVPAADALEITTGELPIVFDLYQKYSYDGVIQWAALKTRSQPRSRIKKSLIENNLWTAELEKLTPNKF